mmetsp:Transcript_43379/g.77958  ORF Transcript_43379/g.77958 Transcript_43379/m.77958 type:complete len:521 (-) Transcript_43379:93-1655(-)
MLAWQGLTTASLQDQYAQNWAALKARAADKEKSLSKVSSEEPVDTDGAGTGGTVMQGGGSGAGGAIAESNECSFRDASSLQPLGPCTPLQLSDWTVDHVNQWLDCTPLPPEATSILKANAINGPVLETLSEEDLERLGLEKFGWRRQMLISRKELLELLDVKRRPPDCAEVFEMSSAIGHSRDHSPSLSSSSPRLDAEGSQGPFSPKSTIHGKSPVSRGRAAGQVPQSGAGALPSTPLTSPCRHTLGCTIGGMRTLVMPPTITTRLESTGTARGMARARWRSPVLPRAASTNRIPGNSYVAIPATTSLVPPTVVRSTSVQRATSPAVKSPRHGSRSVALSQTPGNWCLSPPTMTRAFSPVHPPASIQVTPGFSTVCTSPQSSTYRGLGGIGTTGGHGAVMRSSTSWTSPHSVPDVEVQMQALPFAPPNPPATLLLRSPRPMPHRDTLHERVVVASHPSSMGKGSKPSPFCVGVVVHPPRTVPQPWKPSPYASPNVPNATAQAGHARLDVQVQQPRTRTKL